MRRHVSCSCSCSLQAASSLKITMSVRTPIELKSGELNFEIVAPLTDGDGPQALGTRMWHQNRDAVPVPPSYRDRAIVCITKVCRSSGFTGVLLHQRNSTAWCARTKRVLNDKGCN